MITGEAKGAPFHEWKKILLGGHNIMLRGKLRMNNEGIGWRSKDRTVMLHKKAMEEGYWSRIGLKFEVTIIGKKESHSFWGFEEQDENFLKNFFAENYEVKLEDQPIATVGWNWGKISFDGRNCMSFFVNEEKSFDVPLDKVVRATLNKKNELAIEFEQDAGDANESLMEMRFYIPPKKGKGEENAKRRAENLLKILYEEGQIDDDIEDEEITKFDSSLLKFLSPNRRRYEIAVHESCFQLIGAETFTVKWDNITEMMLLPTPDGENNFFVVSLRNAIRSGLTLKPNIVAQIANSAMIKSLKIESDDHPEIEKIKAMKGEAKTVITDMFSLLSGVTLTTEGTFKSKHKANAVKCNCDGKNDGFLYFLEKGLFFLHKPCLFKDYNDIDFVKFQYHTKEFSLIVSYKESGSDNFVSIKNYEHKNIKSFFASKKIRMEDVQDEIMEVDSESGDEEIRRSSRKGRQEAREKIRKELQSSQPPPGDPESEDDDFKSGQESSEDFSFNISEESEDDSAGKKRKREEDEAQPPTTKKRKLEEEGDKATDE